MNNYKIKVINPNSPYYGKEGTFLGVENGKVNVEIDGKIIADTDKEEIEVELQSILNS